MANLHVARTELGRRVRNGLAFRSSLRGFKTTRRVRATQNYTMPAMSPTMTEGNISKWNIKEGSTFSAGDVLLEIETDKASMDIEAQDDGILAKIMHSDGSKGIKVGTRIAVLADPGDDISGLEIPELESSTETKGAISGVRKHDSSSLKSSSEDKEIASTRVRPQEAKEEPKTGKNKAYPFYPSVVQLLHEKEISISDAKKIPATGPNGRLLKGDVLAYTGAIKPSYSAELSAKILKLGHLDLSNIKLAPKTPVEALPQPTEDVLSEEEDPKKEISIQVSFEAIRELQERILKALSIRIPLETFVTRAIDISNSDLPAQKKPPSADELFNSVLGLDRVGARSSSGSFTPQIIAIPASPFSTKIPTSKDVDIIDILAGKRSISTRPGIQSHGALPKFESANTLRVSVSKADEQRARIFLERMKTLLQGDPGRLVL